MSDLNCRPRKGLSGPRNPARFLKGAGLWKGYGPGAGRRRPPYRHSRPRSECTCVRARARGSVPVTDARAPNSVRTQAPPYSSRETAESAVPAVHRQAANTPRRGGSGGTEEREAVATLRGCRPYLQVVQVQCSNLRIQEIFIGVELSDYIVHGGPPLFLIHCGCLDRSVPSNGGGGGGGRGQGQKVPPTSSLPISWEPMRSCGR